MDIEVKGHSGCQIDVVNENGQIYVYKSTSDPKYLHRLALQAQKQKDAAGVEYQHIRVPQIYSLKENVDTTIVKMQYIYSKNFIEFFEQAGFEQIYYLIGALEHFVEYEISKCEMCDVPPAVFQEKFADVCKEIDCNPFCAGNQAVAALLGRCKDVFDSLKPMSIPVGVCHGDLTFSNILFNGNNYYLIDFLDSFIETPLQDIVKIRQDTAYHWSELMYIKNYDSVRLRIICDKIDSEIDKYFTSKYQWYADNYRVMQLINILRILPYAHEQKVVEYLIDVINKLLVGEDTVYPSTSMPAENGHCKQHTLIMPIAADKPEYAYHMPKVFLNAGDGAMYCIRALRSLEINRFDHVYITILRHLDEKYALADRLKLQLNIYGITNARIIVLDTPTASQPETIYQTIQKMNVHGSIFIKDADCSFTGDISEGNAITIHPLEELDWVKPKNKSYVNVDDMYYITNIIEKRIVSHYFTAGGYSFEDADTYCRYYERLMHQSGLYLSHIIYSMLLDNHTFRPVITREYDDFELKFEKN